MKENVRTKPIDDNQSKACTTIILRAIRDNIKTKKELLNIQRAVCKEYKTVFLTNPMLLSRYRELLAKEKINENKTVFELLRKRKIRTSSGIASVAVLTKPYKCPGNCLFCPTQEDVPKSYIDNEPAVMRAILASFDAVKQVLIRLRGLEISGNPVSKIELIVMGGTFSYLPRKYQLEFIIGCFWACNNYKTQISNDEYENKSDKFKKEIFCLDTDGLLLKLKEEQEKNESSDCRIIGLTLETRPDYIDENEAKWFRQLGCTRVEIGIQSIYDKVLELNRRGHLKDKIVNATKILKDAGFKICYHMMPNLYGSDFVDDLAMFKELFENSDYYPDMLKIYPCVVTKYSDLAKVYKEKKYIPYDDETLIKLLIEIKKILPPYVRIQRLIRDIPSQNIIGGSKITNLRQLIFQKNPNICKCIRCREIRYDTKKEVNIRRFDYNASRGKEIFLEFIDKDEKLYALLRLRIPANIFNNKKHFIEELDKASIIREVHTYGPMLEVGEKKLNDAQHKGLGKRLIEAAEIITKVEFGLSKIAVISGVGVRGYYKKLGFNLVKNYMVKNLK